MKSACLIYPYWQSETGAWVFDDASVGLQQEPFVRGIPDLIDELVKDIPNASAGFRLEFSDASFPGFRRILSRESEEDGGTWYLSDDQPPKLGWLCPALLCYFEDPPTRIYVAAQPFLNDSSKRL